jgi:hypothetical protein
LLPDPRFPLTARHPSLWLIPDFNGPDQTQLQYGRVSRQYPQRP